ncbi:MAG TPA: hypothetical protein VHZ99_12605 [Steroidobacteraceae bacterium]|jgi:hypothetical protein|nr:hypothetical protein [Steroidobacteraceae bacterium]
MSANPDSEEYEEEDAAEVTGDDDLDLDRAIKDMEIAKRRTVKVGEPAWRRLEQRLEQKRTAELISDLEAYDIGMGPAEDMDDISEIGHDSHVEPRM